VALKMFIFLKHRNYKNELKVEKGAWMIPFLILLVLMIGVVGCPHTLNAYLFITLPSFARPENIVYE